ncbi:hypothetical protein [Sphingomonas sp. NPDC079357]|uniref:hypothetical protein n=1 Tax=Sphingomonas sp. NPDC079357 TaxID=3364518 RepID=UPI00384AA83C
MTAAPGVAFSYAYLYTLPAANISRVQELHAQACERLGIDKCRITGMTYHVRGPDDVDGSLEMKLAPALARAFGREGTHAVEATDGMLSSAAIKGTDVGTEIAAAEAASSALKQDGKALDQQIAANRSDRQRVELTQQRAALESQRRDLAANVRTQRTLLASTPLTFEYRAGASIPSLHATTPLMRAADMALASVEATVSFVLQAIAILFAPLLAIALLWLGWRWRGRRLWRWLRGPETID